MSIETNQIPLADGTYTLDVRPDGYINYISFAFDNGQPTAGTATITARAPKSQIFEAIPNGVVQLSSAFFVGFTGPIAQLRVQISGHVGTSNNMDVTLNSFGGPEVRGV
jgi:hypothetical protein